MNKELLAEIEDIFLSKNKNIARAACEFTSKHLIKECEDKENLNIISALNELYQKSPKIENFSCENFEAFKEIYLNTNNIELKASLGYIIGHNKYKFRENHQLVKDTIEHLFFISDNLCASQKLDNDYHKMSEYINQAIELSKLFGKEENQLY
ncbi:MAG: hypothetical protein LBM93_11730 [Oscillospiraceae bacterium]|jgi:hypothetical protein|nr:hypothetical protein [Oscillospiraceae bacterium]